MNKGELYKVIAEKAGSTEKDAKKFLQAFLDTVTETLAKGGEIPLVGFGTFKTSKRKARMGKNMVTGEDIEVPAMTLPVFKAGKNLKNAVNHREGE